MADQLNLKALREMLARGNDCGCLWRAGGKDMLAIVERGLSFTVDIEYCPAHEALPALIDRAEMAGKLLWSLEDLLCSRDALDCDECKPHRAIAAAARAAGIEPPSEVG